MKKVICLCLCALMLMSVCGCTQAELNYTQEVASELWSKWEAVDKDELYEDIKAASSILGFVTFDAALKAVDTLEELITSFDPDQEIINTDGLTSEIPPSALSILSTEQREELVQRIEQMQKSITENTKLDNTQKQLLNDRLIKLKEKVTEYTEE